MPSPGSSPKGSKGKSKSKSKGSAKGKSKSGLSPEELEKLCFGRRRYDNLEAVFIKKSTNIVLFCDKIHIYEVWHRLPVLFTEEAEPGSGGEKSGSKKGSKKSPKGSKDSPKGSKGSPKGSKGSKGSKGGKGSKKSKGSKGSKGSKQKGAPAEKTYDEPIFVDDRPELGEYDRANLVGAVAFPKILCKNGYKIFVEITADFAYYDYGKVPPFPETVVCKRRCYRDHCYIYPYNFDQMAPYSTFAQEMLLKVKHEYPRGWQLVPFVFDLTRKPDSFAFSRPYYAENPTGLHWNVRAFVGMTEYCIPPPENEVSMAFYKYTITPASRPLAIRPSITIEYNRWLCLEDQGSLVLSATLDKDIYYHGEEVNISVQISNDSMRHSVTAISVYIEQTYTFHSQIPHDNSIPLVETFAQSGQLGLPIGPKNKGWFNTFTLRPVYDPYKYNLALDGRMGRDKKMFLAESSVIMRRDLVLVDVPPPESDGDKKDGKKGKGSGKKSKSEGSKGSKSKDKKSPKSKEKSPKSKGGKGGKSKGSKGSKGSKQKGSKGEEAAEEEIPVDPECIMPNFREVNVFTTRQECRIVNISYQAVVRLTLGDEAGHPIVRVPFVLTRNSRYIDQLPERMPPVFAQWEMH
ncbi:unnamed protein product [Mesocestoides corti]|uniref:Arrestin_C domain-containing protein n=1 Tax=Mesocestoides corti TaxID=53468 RepID=A0A0R3U499_MESCO|nr:unnamed protein product [Mesocestoides corti]